MIEYPRDSTLAATPRAILALLLLIALPAAAQDPLLLLKQGADALERGAPQAAVAPLRAAQSRLPRLADYPAFFLAQALFQLKDHAAVPGALEPVFQTEPASPLAGRAALLAARSLLEIKDYPAVLSVLARVPQDQLPQPEATLLLARAHEGTGNVAEAAGAWQTLYFRYPLTPEAADAAKALDALRPSLGDAYPAAPAPLRLERAGLLFRGRQYARARSELEQMLPYLAGLEHDQARVRIGAADYHARKSAVAVSYLNSLSVSDPEADAERLWWLAAAHRRMENDAGMESALARLARLAPDSPWRLQALVLAGNRYLVDNRFAEYLPHYQACADSFPGDRDGAYCHWKVVWRAWLARDPQTATLLRQHLQRFSASVKAGASIYYLGRLAGQSRDFAAAKRFYLELQTRYPNYYYAVLAREELKRPEIMKAAASAETQQFLDSIPFPLREQSPSFESDPPTTLRLERGRLLARAGLERWAEGELRFGARNGANAWVLAIEMAETAARRGAHAQAVRYIKATVPGYLFLPRDAAPERFWRLAFPFPYRVQVFHYARINNLDPFLVASLIRQESEFDPLAVSSAGAIGLMQIKPSTGREVARRLRLGASSTTRLKQPSFNIQIGTHYFRRILNTRNGSIEETLAGYNAGASRVVRWKTWADYREPHEFVESIPFTETRDYVQIIVRNVAIYRWLYASDPLAATPTANPAKPAARKAPAKKAPARRRK